MAIDSLLFLIANIIITIGTLPLIVKAIKNKHSLTAYSLFGAAMTFIGLAILGGAWCIREEWVSLAFAMVTIVYWLTVVLCKIKWR